MLARFIKNPPKISSLWPAISAKNSIIESVQIVKTTLLTNKEYDAWTQDFFSDRDWLLGWKKPEHMARNQRRVLRVMSQHRISLLVDTCDFRHSCYVGLPIPTTYLHSAILQHAVTKTRGAVVWFPEILPEHARASVIQSLCKQDLIQMCGGHWRVTATGEASIRSTFAQTDSRSH